MNSPCVLSGADRLKERKEISLRRKLTRSDYTDASPTRVARFFLGKYLCVNASDGYAEGLITETEAYGGADDAACHAHCNRRTVRTEIMFAPGGVAYVYLCYGLHRLFNIITGPADSPEAVLVRAVRITEGQETVRQRRPGVAEKDWASGPGRVCAALAIGLHHYGCDLLGDAIWLEDRGIRVPRTQVISSPRVGVDYAGKWAAKPWRYIWKGFKDKNAGDLDQSRVKARPPARVRHNR